MKKLITSLFAAVGMISVAHSQTALDFDGNDDVVVIGNSMTTALQGSTTISVEAWVKSSSTTGNGVIVGNYNYPTNSNSMQFMLRRDNDQYVFWLDDGNGYQSIQGASGGVVPGQWQHIAGTWDGSVARIYVDGVENAQNVTLTGPGLPVLTNEVVIGNNAFSEPFTGSIDNVRIWNVNRTATEIANFMDCEVTTNTPGLLASYHFNDGLDGGANATNTLLFDNSGNGYHGTLQNFALTGTSSNFVTSNRTDYMSIQASLGSSAVADRMSPRQSGDFNGDGFDDIIALTEAGTQDIYYSDGFGHFETPVAVPNPIGGGYDVADLDNDGDIDMINYGGSQFKVYVNDGAGNFTEQTPITIDGTGNVSVARIADVNGDNLADIVTGNGGTAATDLNEIWINNGTVGNPSFTFLEGLNSTYAPINGIAIGDIDSDGDVDLAFGGGSFSAVVFNNDNNTTFIQGQALGGYNGYPRFIDWNQDGHLDFVNSDGYNNWGVRVRYNDGTGNFLATAELIVSVANGIDYFSFWPVEYADMNGDGFLDVLSRHWGGNGEMYLSNGCIVTDQTACKYNLGPADNGVMTGDFNGDGKPDVFVGARDRKSSVSLNFLTPVSTPALSDITSTLGDEVCDGDQISIEATVSNTGTVQWFSNSDGSTQIGTGSPYSPTAGPGTYEYYVGSENPNGCRSLLDTVEVIVNENPTASVNTATSITALDCFGDTDGEINVDVTLNGTATTSTYEWDDANTTTTQNLTGIGAGTYMITVTDDNGCTAQASATVSEPTVLSGTTTTTAETNGNDGSIDLTPSGGTAPYSYDWTGPNGFTSTDQSPTGLEGGAYEVTITDNNGCTFVLQVTVDSFVGLESNASTMFNVYPNPSNGSFTIESDSAGSVEIMNMNGKIVYSATTESGKTKLNVPGLARGVYMLRLTSGNSSQLKKMVIR